MILKFNKTNPTNDSNIEMVLSCMRYDVHWAADRTWATVTLYSAYTPDAGAVVEVRIISHMKDTARADDYCSCFVMNDSGDTIDRLMPSNPSTTTV